MKFISLALFLFSLNAMSAEVLNFPATYMVPVYEEDLNDFNIFEIHDYTVINDGSNSKISYTLPLVLTGGDTKQITLNLIEHNGSYRRFRSSSGSAECQGPWAKMKCSTVFNLQPDSAKIESYIRENLAPEIQDKVLRVALGFSTEPIGISETLLP